MSIGFRVCTRKEKVGADVIERFRPVPVANVSDAMHRVFSGGPRLRPYHRDGVLAGAALTVRTRPGDNLMLHKAIDLAEPGDVIVVEAGGDLTNSLMGELMLAYAVRKGVAGFVIDGAIRDVDAFVETNLPTYAAGVTHRGPYKNGPGEINVPVALDGMVIQPGDLILGDSDGVISVPFDAVDEIYKLSVAKHKAEQEQLAAIEAGTNDRSWVDVALAKGGCEFPR